MNRKKKQNQLFNMVLFTIFSAIILLMSLVPNIGYIMVGPIAITIVHIPVLIGIMVLPIVYSIGLGLVFGLGSLLASYLYASQLGNLAFQNPLISVLPRVLFALFAFLIFFGLRKLQKVKHGDTIIFTLVSVITMVFLYFGANALSQMLVTDFTSEGYPFDPIKKLKILTIAAPIFMVVGGLLIGGYYLMLKSDKLKNDISIPTSVMVGTLIHTVLVIAALSIFKNGLEGFIPLLQVLFATNGFIEIILAVIVAPPIALAIRAAFPDRMPEDLITKSIRRKKELDNDSTIWCR